MKSFSGVRSVSVDYAKAETIRLSKRAGYKTGHISHEQPARPREVITYSDVIELFKRSAQSRHVNHHSQAGGCVPKREILNRLLNGKSAWRFFSSSSLGVVCFVISGSFCDCDFVIIVDWCIFYWDEVEMKHKQESVNL
jgi:hypothetical protein